MSCGDIPPPGEPGEGEVLIDVAAAGVNYADLLIIAGKYQERPMPPFTPGFEIAGTRAAGGPALAALTPGNRVLAVLDRGGFAEQVDRARGRTFRHSGPDGFRHRRRICHRLWHVLWRADLARRH